MIIDTIRDQMNSSVCGKQVSEMQAIVKADLLFFRTVILTVSVKLIRHGSALIFPYCVIADL